MATQARKTHDQSGLPSFAEDLKSESGPTPLSYSVPELSQVLISNASQPILPKLTETQRQFLTKCQETDGVYNLEEFRGMLKEALSMLNNAFYFGLFKGKLLLEMRTSPQVGESRKDYQSKGWYTEFWTDVLARGGRNPQQLCQAEGQKPRMILCLHNTRLTKSNVSTFIPRIPEKFTQEDLRQWIGALVHELLHAFLSMYACECWKKCRAEVNDPFEGVGFGYHATKWVEAMEAIQHSCRTILGLENVECGIDDSVYGEITATGWKPTESQIQRWGLDQKNIDKATQIWGFIGRHQSSKNRHDKLIQKWLSENDAE